MRALRSRRAAVLAVLAGTVALAAPAAAHVTASPPWARVGETSVIALDVPNERNVGMTAVVLTAPAGLELVGASGPPGWQASARGSSATWRGRLAPRTSVTLRLEAAARGQPGALELTATQRFADGRVARWPVSVMLLPAPEGGGLGRWPELVGALLLAAALAAIAVAAARRSRRRALHDR